MSSGDSNPSPEGGGGQRFASSPSDHLNPPPVPMGGVGELLSREQELDRTNRLLESIRQAQTIYIAGGSSREVFNKLLQTLVDLTGSEYGFLDEIRRDANGELYKLSLALSDISWDDDSRALYRQLVDRKLEFRNLANLAGTPALTGETVISNAPAADQRAGGIPPGHPSIHSFMGVPIHFGGELIGVMGVANRPGGYDERIGAFIEPFVNTCAGIIHAVRARQAAQESADALRTSETRFRLAMDAADEGLCDWHIPSGERYRNPRFYTMLGYQPGEIPLSFEGWAALLHPEDRDRVLRTIEHHLSGDQPGYEIEFRMRARNGDWRWFLSRGKVVERHSDGIPIRMMGTHLDITPRKQAEEALRESETLLRRAQEIARLGSWSLDLTTNRLTWSDEVYRIFGLHPQEFGATYEAFLNAVHPDDRDAVDTAYSGSLREGKDSYEIEHRVVRKDTGETRYVHEKCEHMRDASGRHIRSVGMVHDITERKQAEKNYETLFREMLDGFALHEIVCDAEDHPVDYRFLAVNPAFERLTGLKAENVVGRTVMEVLPGIEQRWIDTYGQVAITGKPVTFESYSSELGKHFEVTAFRPVPNQFACIFVDITERKRHEEERLQLQDQLRQIQKLEALGQLSANVAHDFGNILTVMRGQLDRARAVAGDDTSILEPLAAIDRTVDQAAGITRSLLTFSRAAPEDQKPVELRGLLRGIQNLLEHCLSKRIQLQLDLPSDRDCWIAANTTHFHQVILNLTLNARDAMPNGGKLRIAAAETDEMREDWVPCGEGKRGRLAVITIEDTGVGIPAEALPRVFEPFFTTKSRGQGTGLGLSIVHGIVKDHNGEITVRSEIGKGTTFTLFLPRLRPEAITRLADARTSPPRGKGERILVGTADSYIGGAIHTFLSTTGYAVLPAGSRESLAGVHAVHQQELRLAILGGDLCPDGAADCITLLRSQQVDLPLIVLASHGPGMPEPDENTVYLGERFSMPSLGLLVSSLVGAESQE